MIVVGKVDDATIHDMLAKQSVLIDNICMFTSIQNTGFMLNVFVNYQR